MSNPSNLYAEKIFAEHPSVLWALDDQLDYLSLISENQRDITTSWSTTNVDSISGVPANIGQPFEDSILTEIKGSVPIGDTAEIVLISDNILNFTSLNQSLKTFCIGTYFYSYSPYIQSVSIGYEYTDTTTSLVVQNLKTFYTQIYDKWQHLSETFEIPDENTDLRLVIKIFYSDGGATSEDYKFHINGISLGQWNENFNAISLGLNKVIIPASIKSEFSYGIEAQAYGIEEFSGYYIIDDGSLKAVNNSIPMVFGARNITTIYPNNNKPSLIIPGKGFLNEEGRYKDYTIEFWLRVNSDTYEPKRIFGPIESADGLYVDSGFLIFVIGENNISHFVGEWFRPMLINIRIINNSASMLINGEEVGQFTFDASTISLPAKTDELNKDQDWLGFYSYTDVSPMEIDCIAIYPYSISNVVAKRRFIYGQAVASPEDINTAYGGVSAFIDYPFANYSVNYSYPSFGKWDQGTFDNLRTTSLFLTTPQYQLPEIFLEDKLLDNLYSDNESIQNEDYKYFTFRPNVSWNDKNCYLNFNRFNFLTSPTSGIYGIFKESSNIDDQILFKIYNPSNSNSFNIIKKQSVIEYSLYFNGISEVIHEEILTFPTNMFTVGINIKKLIDYYGGNIATFFGNQNILKMYSLGDNSGNYTYTGKTYNISLCTDKNISYISDLFSTTGILEQDLVNDLIDKIASYTLFAEQEYSRFYFDIAVAGYWQDYLPLSYFAKYVKNSLDNSYYDLDFIQFNIANPAPSYALEKELTYSWNYGTPVTVSGKTVESLQYEYSNPISKQYSQLSNNLLTGWDNYQDMEQKADKYFEYDTASLPVKTFLTFQYIENGSNLLDEDFTSTVLANEEKVLDLSLYSDWYAKRFEVVNNMLIYPSKSIDFNKIAMVYSIEFAVRGILSKAIGIKNMEFSSQALSENSFNSIGTRFGVPVYPYKKSGFYYDYKSKNPFSIYKGSTPYLYLTKYSGIEVRGEFDLFLDRGISLPINKEVAKNYKVSAMQIWLRYDKNKFPGEHVKIFEIEHIEDTIEFYMVANSNDGNRARIFAISRSTGLPFNGVGYYVDGLLVREPVLTNGQWSSIGINFASSLDFSSFIGSINLTGPMVYNNIAYYRADNLQQVQSRTTRPWLQVKETPFEELEWLYWKNNARWNEVLVVAITDIYGVNTSDIYKTYTGTNKIIIDDSESVSIDSDKIKIYTEATWQRFTVTPV